MADATITRSGGSGSGSGNAPAVSNPIARLWRRTSPSLVSVFAVLTAMLFTVPLMMLASGQSDLGAGLNRAFTAYAALIEGSAGIAINNMLGPNDVDVARQFAAQTGLTDRDLRQLAGRAEQIALVGGDNVQRYAATIRAYQDRLDPIALDQLGLQIPIIQEIGASNLRGIGPLLENLSAIPSSEALGLARQYTVQGTINEEQRAQLQAQFPAVADLDDNTLLNYLRIIEDRNGIFAVRSAREQLLVLDGLALEVTDSDAQNFYQIASLATQSRTGSENVLTLDAVETQLLATGITDEAQLAQQLNLVNRLYNENVLTNPDVSTALNEELAPFLSQNFVVYRPGNQPVLINPNTTAPTGTIYNENRPDDPTDDRIFVVYARLNNSALLFFPASFEQLLTRAIPFIIAGLAIALGFKAGLFNIGAEGQLYIAGVVAAFVGFSPIFSGLPAIVHVPLVFAAGVLGGALWGFIPGALKAYTGAHEVINTIMLNFIAIRLTDWMIKSRDVLRDPTASSDRTPIVAETARLGTFDQINAIWFLAVAVLFAAGMFYRYREPIRRNPLVALRPIGYGVAILVGGLFLQWVSVGGILHLGFVIMLLAVWFVDWFLERTTPGFELRTVGANPNAAQYAGMNVKWNIILAMMLSGALAGLAGTIEISSVQFNMPPEFFAGIGFDAIAVALLARSNPRNMIPAGLLWAFLITGTGLMQLRVEIGIDIVKIMQALIIMFIAADTIIRYLWRIPEAKESDKVTMFSKGWGG
ncbi:MAG: ABC transporter permease [Anaerolineae bacterium]|jgi:simple sugar transport system permease protein|nr:ABC transporter permease [Anaerolineae bacterium]